MMTEPDIKYCLFLCTHRNEGPAENKLKRIFHTIQEQGVSVMTIKIGSIEKNTVNTMLSETLCLPPCLCSHLSSIIHNRTGGVILFVMNFLRSLNEEGLLWFNLSSRRWDYDIEAIQQKEVSEDVVQHVSERMTRLPEEMQFGLKLCSCLGASFKVDTLTRGSPANELDTDEFLPLAVEVSEIVWNWIGGFVRIERKSSHDFSYLRLSRVVFYERMVKIGIVGLMIRYKRRPMI